jgi:hypothetical protein
MYKTGDQVKALYSAGGKGTILGPGVVQEVTKRPDGWFSVLVELSGEGGRTQSYTVSKSGHSDYLLPVMS